MAIDNYGDPTVISHHFNVGVVVTGIDPNGTYTPDLTNKGRVVDWVGCTDGGKFDAPELWGMSLQQVLVELPGVTQIQVVSTDGVNEFVLFDSILNADYPVDSFHWTPRGAFIPPGWSIKVKSDFLNVHIVVPSEVVTVVPLPDGIVSDFVFAGVNALDH
ncbi:hypothetical protein KAU11_10055, partial [Candidatus Babeliales bacterium]|nr:hypothetical protein [Candidatus Babeliales bacterium]